MQEDWELTWEENISISSRALGDDHDDKAFPINRAKMKAVFFGADSFFNLWLFVVVFFIFKERKKKISASISC